MKMDEFGNPKSKAYKRIQQILGVSDEEIQEINDIFTGDGPAGHGITTSSCVAMLIARAKRGVTAKEEKL